MLLDGLLKAKKEKLRKHLLGDYEFSQDARYRCSGEASAELWSFTEYD